MQANSIIIPNYDSLCYSIVPKLNKDLSLNLLESVLYLFVKVRMFLFSRDIKEKHKVKKKKWKALSPRTEIKKSFSSKVFNHWILLIIQFSLRPTNFKVGHKTAIFIATHLKLHYLQLKLRLWLEEDLSIFWQRSVYWSKDVRQLSWMSHGVMRFWLLLNFLFSSALFDILASLSISRVFSSSISGQWKSSCSDIPRTIIKFDCIN